MNQINKLDNFVKEKHKSGVMILIVIGLIFVVGLLVFYGLGFIQ